MVKQIRITLDDEEHKRFLKFKVGTWYDVLRRGIISMVCWPDEMDWVDFGINSNYWDKYEELCGEQDESWMEEEK